MRTIIVIVALLAASVASAADSQAQLAKQWSDVLHPYGLNVTVANPSKQSTSLLSLSRLVYGVGVVEKWDHTTVPFSEGADTYSIKNDNRQFMYGVSLCYELWSNHLAINSRYLRGTNKDKDYSAEVGLWLTK